MIRFMIELILYAAYVLLVCAGVCFGLLLWWAKSFDEHLKKQARDREQDMG
jgi:hypothetical protein